MDMAKNTALTVLVVDDDEDMLFMMQQVLIAEGYNPIFSPNGHRVMEIITQHPPDLILMDLNLHGLNGAALCKAIKNSPFTARIPIVLFSANENLKAAKLGCGADAYLNKPFDMTKLRMVFTNILNPDLTPPGIES